MKPLRSIIEGIGPHKHADIDWSALESPVAIVADKGTGKTWLLEAPLAALFGSFAWYPVSLYKTLTTGGSGEGRIALEFEHGGIRYFAERLIKDTGKTQSQTAILRKYFGKALSPSQDSGVIEQDAWIQIAGPKVGDFNRAIEAMIGDQDTALATWLLSQNRYGDLIGQPGDKDLVTRRRKVFHGLIGAQHLDKIEERIGERQRDTAAIIQELTAQLADCDDPTPEILRHREMIKDGLARSNVERGHLASFEQSLETARQKLVDAKSGDAELEAQIEKHEMAQQRAAELRERLAALEGEAGRLKAKAAGLDAAKADVDKVQRLEGALAEFEAQKEPARKWQEWQRLMERLAQMTIGLSRECESLGPQILPPETAALAAQLEQLREEFKKATSENTAREQRNAELALVKSVKGEKTAGILGLLTEKNRRSETEPETLFGDKCQPCPFMQEYAKLSAEIIELMGQSNAINDEIEALPEPEKIIDLKPLIERGEQAQAAQREVEQSAAAEEKYNVATLELREAESHFSNHQQNKPPEVEDPRDAIAEINQQIIDLNSPGQRVKAAEEAALELKENKMKSHEIGMLNKKFSAEASYAQGSAESARAALADRSKQRADLESQVVELAEVIGETRNQINGIVEEVAGHKAKIEALTEQLEQQGEKRKRLNSLADDKEGLRDLRQCFGIKGVRQILIDDAAPALEAIAAELFECATEGRQHLRIATQTANRDGSLAEDFQIMIRTQKGERDALEYSGGELQLIIILFRIAVALWVGHLRGQRPECLWIDEAFDRMGALGSGGPEELLRVIDYLDGQFEQIVVVTHDTAIAARMRSQVILKERFSDVEIELRGAKVVA